MHVSRLKFPGPATEETRVTDGAGDPLLVVMAEPSTSLAGQIRGLLPELRDLAGKDRKVTLCFDRGGWSPDLFADIIDAGFDLLTYRKNDTGKQDGIPAHPGPRPARPLRPRRRRSMRTHPRSPHHQRRHQPRQRRPARPPRPAHRTPAHPRPRALCQQLSATATRYPGTTLTLRYEVKDHPGTA